MRIETPEPDNEPMGPFSLFFFALLSLGFSIFIYSHFSELEASGGSVRMNMIFIGIYKLFGKVGITVPFVVIGFSCFFLGFRRLLDE